MIRVLVVDDSAFMRKVITDIIERDPQLQVVGKARDGIDALEKIVQCKPDVVTMDIEMPGLDGLSALAKIMSSNPVPIIMLSSLSKASTERTVKALELGAVDFIAKPSGPISLDISSIEDEITKKIKLAAGTEKLLQKNFKTVEVKPKAVLPFAENKNTGDDKSLNKLLVIGTSTGGPKALHQVIPYLPKNLPAGVLIVQHMPPGFTKSLAERLHSLSEINVKEAEHGEEIKTGWAYIAPGDSHLAVDVNRSGSNKKLMVRLDKSELVNGHRPAVDVMFKSAAEQFWGHLVGVIMTGMGSDGANGLKLVKERGGMTIAEHQSTCIVYGMPKAAVENGCVDKIVPLPEISQEIVKMLR